MGKGDIKDSGIKGECGKGMFKWLLRGEVSKVGIEGEE